MITNANFDIYADPINYDLESGRYTPDGSILLELARQASGPVLELGCGTGRITKPVKLALRYIMPQEMEAVLHYNGFKVLARYGDWQGNPLSETGCEQIYICTHRSE